MLSYATFKVKQNVYVYFKGSAADNINYSNIFGIFCISANYSLELKPPAFQAIVDFMDYAGASCCK
jgi:hypothetical protein